jgi:hypothetical protein
LPGQALDRHTVGKPSFLQKHTQPFEQALLEDAARLTPMTATAFCTSADTLATLLQRIDEALLLETNDKELTAQVSTTTKKDKTHVAKQSKN